MLNKILRHEFKSFGRKLFPLLPILVALAGVSCLFRELAVLVFRFVDTPWMIPFFVILVLLSVVTGAAALIGPVAVPVVVLIQRYWNTMTSSEAYLTFTLPVKVSTHLWARLLSSLIYLSSGLVASFISSRLMLFIPVADINVGVELYRSIPDAAVYELSLWFGILLSLLAFLMQVYTAVSISTQFGKNRGIASFIAYLGIGSAISAVHTGFSTAWLLFAKQPYLPLTSLLTGITASSNDMGLVLTGTFFTSVESALWSIAFILPLYFFLSRYLFNNKMALQ